MARCALTIVIALVALSATLHAGLGALLEYDRTAIAGGQWWRMITGHLPHWSMNHLFWDLAVFVGLGAICERLHRPRFAMCVVGAAVLIALVVWFGLSGMLQYRGLSGLDSALAVLLAMHVLRRGWPARGRAGVSGGGWWPIVLAGGFLAAFLGKTVYEWVTGQCLFVDTGGAFVAVPLAHVAGAPAGLAAGMVGRPGERVGRSRRAGAAASGRWL